MRDFIIGLYRIFKEAGTLIIAFMAAGFAVFMVLFFDPVCVYRAIKKEGAE